jgi:hypothetical protein
MGIENDISNCTQTRRTSLENDAMLDVATVNEVRRLLDEGCYSHREIARRTGVSRGSVDAIADGRRAHHGREDRAAESQAKPPHQRCAECGDLVRLPCVACQARDYLRRKRRLSTRETHVGESRAVRRHVA